MPAQEARTAIVVTSHAGQPTCAELARLAAVDQRPRKDYVELARRLDADVIDGHWMLERAAAPARLAAERGAIPTGQVLEVFLRRRRWRHVLAWSERVGLPLATLLKLSRSHLDLVMVAAWMSRPRKAVFLRRLRAHSHIRTIITRARQAEIAVARLGVPRSKFLLEPRPVDDRFWRPLDVEPEPLIAAAGWEARDYPTLIDAVRGVDVDLRLAVGSMALPELAGAAAPVGRHVARLTAALPPNARAGELSPRELRTLYARCRFVVVPVREVPFDAGVTAVTEAWAMGKAVIASRTSGLADLFDDGVQGVYVPPGDVPAMRAAIEQLLSDPAQAERMGRAGRALVERRHRMDPCLDRFAEIVRGDGAPAASAAT